MRPLTLIPAAILTLALAACLPPPKKTPSGAEDFASYCSACHGADATGKSEIATTLAVKPADLTRLSARNGGTFPATPVMAKIWGYAGVGGSDDHAVMPEFAALLDSDLVPYDGGDGRFTPTPRRLVQIAEYLKTIQR